MWLQKCLRLGRECVFPFWFKKRDLVVLMQPTPHLSRNLILKTAHFCLLPLNTDEKTEVKNAWGICQTLVRTRSSKWRDYSSMCSSAGAFPSLSPPVSFSLLQTLALFFFRMPEEFQQAAGNNIRAFLAPQPCVSTKAKANIRLFSKLKRARRKSPEKCFRRQRWGGVSAFWGETQTKLFIHPNSLVVLVGDVIFKYLKNNPNRLTSLSTANMFSLPEGCFDRVSMWKRASSKMYTANAKRSSVSVWGLIATHTELRRS